VVFAACERLNDAIVGRTSELATPLDDRAFPTTQLSRPAHRALGPRLPDYGAMVLALLHSCTRHDVPERSFALLVEASTQQPLTEEEGY
jgi:hypothetical protein